MGYILPIVHHNYRHYHERTIQENRQRSYIEKPFKVVLNEISQHESLTQKYQYDHNQSAQSTERITLHSMLIEPYKGIFWDEKI